MNTFKTLFLSCAILYTGSAWASTKTAVPSTKPASLPAVKPSKKSSKVLQKLRKQLQDLAKASIKNNKEKRFFLTLRLLRGWGDYREALTWRGYRRFQNQSYWRFVRPYKKNHSLLGRMFEFTKKRNIIHFSVASTAELRKGHKSFPVDMKRVAPFLKPGLQWVKVQITEPGKKNGVDYTVFVYLKNRWVYLPKLWLYIDTRRKVVRQTLKQSVYMFCHVLRLSGAAALPASQKAFTIANWLQFRIGHRDTYFLFRAFDALTVKEKAKQLFQLAKRAGVSPCPLVHAMYPPSKKW